MLAFEPSPPPYRAESPIRPHAAVFVGKVFREGGGCVPRRRVYAQGVQPENLDRLLSVSRPAVHPDGWAVVSAVRPDFAADAYVGQLWRVPLEGGVPHRITRGFRDTAPRLSPDGLLIGFLRATPDGPPQLAIVRAAGGSRW